MRGDGQGHKTEKNDSDNKYQLILALTWASVTAEKKKLRRKGKRNDLRLGGNKDTA